MASEFVPDERLGQIAREIGLTGTTLPRSILAGVGWPQALIEDYDAKGREQARGNDDVVQAAAGALTAQRWAATNQQSIVAITNRVNTLENQVVSLDSRVTANASNIATNAVNIATNTENIATNTSNIATNTAAISALSDRVDVLEMQIPMLQPQTGTAAPEGSVTTSPNTPNTCLLYTSPSPRDRTRSRMPSSA